MKTTSHSAPVEIAASNWRAFAGLDRVAPSARKLLVTDAGDLPIVAADYTAGALALTTADGDTHSFPHGGTVTLRNPQTSVAAILGRA